MVWDGTHMVPNGPSPDALPSTDGTPLLSCLMGPPLVYTGLAHIFILFGTLDSAFLICSPEGYPCIHGGHCTEPGVWLVSRGL